MLLIKSEKLKIREIVEDVHVGGRVILKWILISGLGVED